MANADAPSADNSGQTPAVSKREQLRRRRRGRPGGLAIKTRAAQLRFLRAYITEANVVGAARLAKIDRQRVYEWMQIPEFKTAFELAETDALDYVQGKAFERAREHSDTLMMFILRRRHPAYKDPPKVAAHEGVPGFQLPPQGQQATITQTTTVKVETLSDGELDQLERLLLKAGAQVKPIQKAIDAAITVEPVNGTNGHAVGVTPGVAVKVEE